MLLHGFLRCICRGFCGVSAEVSAGFLRRLCGCFYGVSAEVSAEVPAEVSSQGSAEGTKMILGFAGRYACLGDLDKWAASRLQVACK